MKSAEKNVAKMYLARLEILGLDGNENLAMSTAFPMSNMTGPIMSDCLSGGYFSMLNLSSSPPPGYVATHINGHTSPVLSPVDPTVTNTPSWLTTALSPTSPTISNMMGGLVASQIHPLLNRSTAYQTSSTPHPPPGLGPPVSVASIHNGSSVYLANYSGSAPNSSGYVGNVCTGNNYYAFIELKVIIIKLFVRSILYFI